MSSYLREDQYEKLRLLQRTKKRLQNLKLLPVLEFRIEKFAGVDFGSHKRINLHVIFSDEIDVETITSQFLNTLEQSYTLETGDKWTRTINRNSVEELGAKIKAGVPEEQRSRYKSDLVEGFNNLNVDDKQIFNALDKDCFKGKYLIAVGKTEWADLRWTDSSIATKKSIINNADIVFTAVNTTDQYTKSRNQLLKQQVNDKLLDCSDAHYYSDATDKDRIGNSLTWIKADPTFDGLVHAVQEFEERIFVGDEPALFERVNKNKTKYLEELNVSSVPSHSDPNNVWFDQINIPLNKELVAIIGNKGSGKSAIADIVSLCANYYDDEDFSFLTSKKFREKRGKIAQNFEAQLTWESGVVNKKGLYETPDSEAIREVKYLPQGLFEKLTNEISTVEEFQSEIEGVVFSHIPDSEKLNTSSFSELVELKTINVDDQISHFREQLQSLNRTIIEHEVKATSSFKKQLEAKLQQKRKELSALTQPETVANPNEDPEKKKAHEAANNKLTKIRAEIEGLEKLATESVEAKKKLLISKNKLETVKSSVIQKESEFKLYVQELTEELSGFNLNAEQLVSFNFNVGVIDIEVAKISKRIRELDNLLSGSLGEEQSDDSSAIPLNIQLETKRNELLVEKGKLDTEQQQYQAYLTSIADWEKDKQLLIGDINSPETIKYLEDQIEYLNERLQSDLTELYDKRNQLVENIFSCKQEVVGLYKDAREKLNEIIGENSETLQDYKIEVDASLAADSKFEETFLSHILQNKAGSFYSSDGAEKQFKQLVADVDFDNLEELQSFIADAMGALRTDLRIGQKNVEREVADQVRDVQAFYNYLFGLNFITHNYQLKQGGKGIDQLSPGERGALLLVFYLLLDKNNIPLIIDQPEDNLDNHSVATILVPFIKAAKKKRQIIMVTHNPNLAIVSDAEQVIYVHLDKEHGYRFSAESGSIENKEINKRIVNVLEGAMPAFNTRKRKYFEEEGGN
ncbi:TrlF family AAA-like ATPase [Pseudoalteromonas sp. SSMSWG5]|uniref:TrlF family AAA-like ATPase n=1 Tax=Pseudoalteromonas sp. SSMSWG5 TaxID=3139396 RepID=UPI003BAAD026